MSMKLTRNTTMLVVIFAALLCAVAQPAMAQVGAGFGGPILTKVTKVVGVTGTVSATVNFMGRPSRILDNARGEYAGAYPIEVGGAIDICPNPSLDSVLPNAHVVALAAVTGDTMPSYCWDRKKGIGSFGGAGVKNLEFDGKKYHDCVQLDAALGVGTQVRQYYGLIAGGERNDHTAIILIHWPETKEISRLVNAFRFITVRWPATAGLPSFEGFCQFLEDAGCGGVRADIYDRLVERQARQSAPVSRRGEGPEQPADETPENNNGAAVPKKDDNVAKQNENNERIANAVATASAQALAANKNVNDLRAELAEAGITKDGIDRIVGMINGLQGKIDIHDALLRSITKWFNEQEAASASVATPLAASADPKPATCRYWDSEYQSGHLKVTAKVDGVCVSVSYGRNPVVDPDTKKPKASSATMAAGRWATFELASSMRVEVSASMADGSRVCQVFGPNGPIN